MEGVFLYLTCIWIFCLLFFACEGPRIFIAVAVYETMMTEVWDEKAPPRRPAAKSPGVRGRPPQRRFFSFHSHFHVLAL